MKITDIILDFLSETAIYEMVRDRQRVFDRLRNKSEVLQDHLVKILMFGKNTREYNGWISELKAFSGEIISAIARYRRKTGKNPTHHEIMDIFNEYSGTLTQVKRIVYDIRDTSWKSADRMKLSRMPVIQEEVIVHKQLSEILSTVSILLEQGEIPDYDEILNKYL